MKPYYTSEYGTLYHGDCRDVLPTLPPVSVVITDPPYNMGLTYAGHDDSMSGYEEWCRSWFRELERLCPIGVKAISCGITNLPVWCAIKQPDWVMCWYKPAAMGRSPIGFNGWEPILLYGKKKTDYVGPDIVNAPIIRTVDSGTHPCPKPLKWAMDQVRYFATRDATVLDPFGGSGTVAVACEIFRRNWILIEESEEYCDIIVARLRDKGKSAALKRLSKK